MFKLSTVPTAIIVAAMVVPACSSSGLKANAHDVGAASGGEAGSTIGSATAGGWGGTFGSGGAGGGSIGGTGGSGGSIRIATIHCCAILAMGKRLRTCIVGFPISVTLKDCVRNSFYAYPSGIRLSAVVLGRPEVIRERYPAVVMALSTKASSVTLARPTAHALIPVASLRDTQETQVVRQTPKSIAARSVRCAIPLAPDENTDRNINIPYPTPWHT